MIDQFKNGKSKIQNRLRLCNQPEISTYNMRRGRQALSLGEEWRIFRDLGVRA